MLARRRRRRANIKTTQGQRLVLDGFLLCAVINSDTLKTKSMRKSTSVVNDTLLQCTKTMYVFLLAI